MRPLPTLFYTALAALLTGCGNPADQVTPAAVKPAATPPESAPESSGPSTRLSFAKDSRIDFIGSKVTGQHLGGFKEFSGVLVLKNGQLDAVGSTVEIDMHSLWTDAEKLTLHLKSPDFFNVAMFPSAAFMFTAVDPLEDGKTRITGNLTLHGVTKSIAFPAVVKVTNNTLSLKAEFFIKRFDFDIKYPGKTDDLIRDEVVIKLDVVAKAD